MEYPVIVPVPQFTAPSYGSETINPVQRCVNFRPEQTPNGWQLVSTPGYGPWARLDASNAVRGIHYSSTGKLFVAVNATVYEVDSTGSASSRGSIAAGSSNVYMADNGIDLLIIIDGASTGYSLVMASGSVASIADVNFPQSVHVAFQDGYFIAAKANSGLFYLSDLLSATDWTGPTFATAEAKGDILVAVFSDGQYLHLLGKLTKETWYNTGGTFPFERVNGATANVGCPNAALAAMHGGTLYFQGDSTNSQGIWECRGTETRRISPPYIEKLMQQTVFSWAMCYTIDGISYFELTSTTLARSIVYNITNQTWFEKAGNASASDYDRLRWVVNAFNDTYGGTIGVRSGSVANLVYVALPGSLYGNSETYGSPVDFVTQAIVRQRIFGPIQSNSKRVFHRQIRIEAEYDFDDTGTTSTSASLDWTDDGGLTYSTAITLTKAVTSSTTGQRAVFTANRLGASAERYYRITFTGPAAKIILKKCELDLEEGRF